MMTTHEPREPEGSDLFAALPVIDAETTRRLHDRLVRDAQTAGLLDVAYRTIDSPVGPLLLAATAKGLVRVAYGCEDHDKVLEHLARDISPRILYAPARLDVAAKEIDEMPKGQMQFLVTVYGEPMSEKTLRNKVAAWCKAIKMPDACCGHGLRKASCRLLASGR